MDIGSILFYGALTLTSAFIAYAILERFFPLKLKEKEESHATIEPVRTVPSSYGGIATVPKPRGAFDPNIGFRSFQTGAELTVDDIVKGLSRQ